MSPLWSNDRGGYIHTFYFLFSTGIISDAAVISFVMMLIVWAMKQERLTEENSLDVPAQWLQ